MIQFLKVQNIEDTEIVFIYCDWGNKKLFKLSCRYKGSWSWAKQYCQVSIFSIQTVTNDCKKGAKISEEREQNMNCSYEWLLVFGTGSSLLVSDIPSVTEQFIYF